MVGNSSRSAVADFKRGVKRDKTHYPVLKDDIGTTSTVLLSLPPYRTMLIMS
jgi:hypothetical protein